ncbi:MAG: hypothetical protein GKR93_15390 [Gammaproteobacteria bacterium]|nr:hypothetical protein [Gammaproteobacteria bacterium]
MSKLEELKKQASDATLRNQGAEPAGESDEQKWRKLSPVMKYLKSHFTELASTLNVLENETFIDFEINDSVTMKRLKCQNYKISHPSADKERDWVFEFENSAENPSYALLPSGTSTSNFKALLTDNRINCITTSVEGNKSVKFEIKPPVKTKYRFTAELDRDAISLTIRNYSSLWSQTNYLKKSDITAELMDELTHHVMREANKYNEMVGNTISDEARTQLRAKLQADITAKKLAAEKEEARLAQQQKGKKEKTILGKFFKKK